MYKLECPNCKNIFFLEEEHETGYCPNCAITYFYWDYIEDAKTYEEFFGQYYWGVEKK